MTEPNVNSVEASAGTSSSLLVRVKARDKQAWERLVKLYTPLVYRWCRQSGLQPADAADVGQEVFQAVTRKIEDFRHDGAGATFRGWLRTITRNKVIDHTRPGHAGCLGTGGEEGQSLMALLPAGEPDSSAAAVSEENRILYQRALELIRCEFEDTTWRAFWRLVVDGQSAADVAQELGTSVNAVYLAKSRVLRRLRTEFAGLVDG